MEGGEGGNEKRWEAGREEEPKGEGEDGIEE
jgi:hypothetical protein